MKEPAPRLGAASLKQCGRAPPKHLAHPVRVGQGGGRGSSPSACRPVEAVEKIEENSCRCTQPPGGRSLPRRGGRAPLRLGGAEELHGAKAQMSFFLASLGVMFVGERPFCVAMRYRPAELPAIVVMVGYEHDAQQKKHGKHGTESTAGSVHCEGILCNCVQR